MKKRITVVTLMLACSVMLFGCATKETSSTVKETGITVSKCLSEVAVKAGEAKQQVTDMTQGVGKIAEFSKDVTRTYEQSIKNIDKE